MLVEENTNEKVAPAKKRTRKTKGGAVHDFKTEIAPTCGMLGLVEKETEALFSVGTFYISAQAVEILNAQLAEIRREKRGA